MVNAQAARVRIAKVMLQQVMMVPVGVLLYALFLRVALVTRTGFDGLYGQDAFAYYDYAAAFKMALSQGQVPPPFFWPIGFPALAVLFSFIWPLATAVQISNIVIQARLGNDLTLLEAKVRPDRRVSHG